MHEGTGGAESVLGARRRPLMRKGKLSGIKPLKTGRHRIGKVLGGKHTHKSSIPQGCPFSMNLIALLMKPWINMMRDKDLEARTLADGLFFYGTGKNHNKKVKKEWSCLDIFLKI